MKLVLLISITLMLPLVSGNDQPCKKNNNNNAYNQFVKKHIVQDDFDRTSTDKWEEYIAKKNLGNRPTQSFFEKSDADSVNEICNGKGRPLQNGVGNLCMSDAMMQVYDLTVNNGKVLSLEDNNKKVILACDVVVNQCRPVHYEKNNGQQADMTANPCEP